MADIGVRAVITAKDEASAVLKKFSKTVESVSSGASKALGSAVRTAAIAGTVAIGGLAAAAVDMVNSFNESEKVSAQLNAVLKSTGGVAGVTADMAEKLASSLQKVTTYSDEEIGSAENLLLTFTKIGKDTFPDVTESVLDMATALHKDLGSASIQIGKAMQGNANSITALRKSGVDFTDAQQNMIEALFATGDAAGAQKIILKELQKEFGGSSKAAGKTFAGSLKILNNQLDDVKESFGKVIVDAITPFTKKLADFVASDKFKAWVEDAIKKLKDFGKTVQDYVLAHKKEIINMFHDLWSIVKDVAGVVADATKFFIEHRDIMIPIAAIVLGLAAAFKALATALAIVDLIKSVSAAMTILNAATSFSGVVTILTGAFSGLIAVLAAPFVIAIAGVALIWAAQKAVEALANAWDHAASSQAIATQTGDNLRANNLSQYKAGKISRERYDAVNSYLATSDNFTGKADGGSVVAGQPYMVGEVGKEMFVPNTNGKIVPNHQLKSGGSNQTVNVTFNGVFTGNEQEFRKLAVKMMGAFNDAQGMGNI